jgi:hypothetical protein
MNSRIGGTALLAAVAAATTVAITAASPGDAASDTASMPCTATFQPDSVHIRQEPMTIVYELSEDVGQVTSVMPPEDSGLEVLSYSVEDRTLDLDTGGALEGAWTLRFVGDAELTCAGTLNVLMGR